MAEHPTTLAGWVEHCRERAAWWDDVATVHASEYAAAWRALADLADGCRTYAPSGAERDNPETVAAVTRVAAFLEGAMTTTTTALCGYRWPIPPPDGAVTLVSAHTCDEPASHDDPCPAVMADNSQHRCREHAVIHGYVHRCRCGATTDGSTR
jgi:hypothetical protein